MQNGNGQTLEKGVWREWEMTTIGDTALHTGLSNLVWPQGCPCFGPGDRKASAAYQIPFNKERVSEDKFLP